ncbi:MULTISPECIES: formate dehydrogenase subunit gamma [Pseudomonas]|uniref:formate dehydrogenase subunit gamma n=1 Tax=Pseudomonas TaxID=286 RepID=UPI000F7AE50C|nr:MULTISPECIES: formate dehydrogenase subunit gamma [Pseudomonas]MBA1248052.1 formate dehydrogenase subunit gamma [Pseudomonas zeshuii]MBW5411650.1 formate dehydrogenase subunit gamma [Pseudomonas sp. MAG002Y]QEU30069.1 formate dehydrogenase subunit gamma [Pseudomonas luteola]RRW47744.1 formate dehydrogenase subunit gamma [Pseudomonas luteola]
MKKEIVRYGASERTNHWAVAILFFMAGLSGLALFHPALFWLTNLFGGGPWTRILHPFMGVAMFLFFMGLVIRFWHHNILEKRDMQWVKQIGDVLNNREDKLPEIGKYNPGQKVLFWVLLASMLVLMFSGIVIWREYFSHFFPIGGIRLAALAHAAAAFLLILSIIVHIYAGIWIKGSIGAMLHGKVSLLWAKKHHSLWYKDITRDKK